MRKALRYLTILQGVNGPLDVYTNRFALDRLTPGVDNIRYDAHVSPNFIKLADAVTFWMLAGQTRPLKVASVTSKDPQAEKNLQELKAGFAEVMHSAVNHAKLTREPQVIFLAQAAVTKIFLRAVNTQFDLLVDRYKQLIRKHEISRTHDLSAVFRIKEDMAKVQQNRLGIILGAHRELWKYFSEVWKQEIRQGCIANFGNETSLPEEFFNNPVLFVSGNVDDYFMIDEYILLSHRFDDPLRYDAVLSLLKNFIAGSSMVRAGVKETDEDAPVSSSEPDAAEGADDDEYIKIVNALCRLENIDTLFDEQQTRARLKKTDKKDKAERKRLKKLAGVQGKLLNCFYTECRKAGVLKVILAFYAMQDLLELYCPALLPHEVLVYLVTPGERKKIVDKLKRAKSLSGKSFSVRPLNKAAGKYRNINKKKKKEYLLQFLKHFVTYHRDFSNFRLFHDGLQWVNILEDEKRVNLSRVNRTLYDFGCADDQSMGSRPIRNHVILKTDLRGSTEITSRLSRKGLNPASYFSLNFFDPINAVLPEYGASKVFIEGDAMILSIFEEEDAPGGWYGVARASGLAMQILNIVQRYNIKSKENGLPILEQGIGICFRNNPPAFLFDGDNRIMISSAINRADRLSSCAKPLKKMLAGRKDIFNIYVFASASSSTGASDNDAGAVQYLRYNVNGIELDAQAFKKLGQEIDLKSMDVPIPELKNKRVRVHTGIFPTQSGKYKRLVVRESRITEIDPVTFRPRQLTSESYYEVCTYAGIYDRIKKHLNSKI